MAAGANGRPSDGAPRHVMVEHKSEFVHAPGHLHPMEGFPAMVSTLTSEFATKNPVTVSYNYNRIVYNYPPTGNMNSSGYITPTLFDCKVSG